MKRSTKRRIKWIAASLAIVTVLSLFAEFLFTAGLLGSTSVPAQLFGPNNLTAGTPAQFALFVQSTTSPFVQATGIGSGPWNGAVFCPNYGYAGQQASSFDVYSNGADIAHITPGSQTSGNITLISRITGKPMTDEGGLNYVHLYPSSPSCISYCFYPVSPSGSWTAPTPAAEDSAWFVFNYTPSIASSYNLSVTMTTQVLGGACTFTYLISSVTVKASASTSQAPPQSSPPGFSLSAIGAWISAALKSIYNNFLALFNTPVAFTAGVNATPENVSYVGQSITRTLSVSIPSSLHSTPWTLGASKLINTQCVGYVFENATQAFVYQGTPWNATASTYSTTLTYTPSQASIYIFGISCESSQTVFTTSWSAWTARNQTVSSYAPVDVLNQGASLTAPTTSPGGISWNSIVSFFNGLALWFSNLFKGL